MGNEKAVDSGEEEIQYGAPTLKKLARKYTRWGLAIAVAFHFVAVGAYWGFKYLSRENGSSRTVRLLTYSELGPPPSITNQQTLPKVVIQSQMVKPTFSVPVPVPDAEVSPEQTIATQQELSKIAGPLTQGNGGDSVGVSMGDFKVSDEDVPAAPVRLDKQPVMLNQVIPEYPEWAEETGVTATVQLDVTINALGQVQSVSIVKSGGSDFARNAIKAVQATRFQPYIKNGVAVPAQFLFTYHFVLQ